MKIQTKVTTVFDRILNLLSHVARILVILQMLGITTEVATRYFLHKPITGVIEVTEVMILWITFLGAAWLLKEGGHVRMEILVTRLKPRAQTALTTITYIVSAIVCLVLIWYGVRVTADAFREGTIQAGLIGIPTSLVIIIIPIGSLLLFIQYLRRVYGYLRGAKAPANEQ